MSQYDDPCWEPLCEVLGERLTGGFMWMNECRLEDGTSLHAYKHIFTRRYLYLSPDRRAFELAPCGLFVPLRLDFAIQRALCNWWILSGWEAADADEVHEAVLRAQRSEFGDS
jgi:hypothetical protein